MSHSLVTGFWNRANFLASVVPLNSLRLSVLGRRGKGSRLCRGGELKERGCRQRCERSAMGVPRDWEFSVPVLNLPKKLTSEGCQSTSPSLRHGLGERSLVEYLCEAAWS